MEEFFSDRMLLSLPGCVTLVISGTQVLKKFFSFSSKHIALCLSIFIAIARIFAVGEYDVTSILIGIINVLPILWGATGGYDAFMKNKEKKNTLSTNSSETLTITSDTQNTPTLNIEIIDNTNNCNMSDTTDNDNTNFTNDEINNNIKG